MGIIIFEDMFVKKRFLPISKNYLF